ncbi:hypothetical protein ACFXG8_31045 [Kitasatospora indigofera]
MGIATRVGETPDGPLASTPAPAEPESGPSLAQQQNENTAGNTPVGSAELPHQRPTTAPRTILPGHRSTTEDRARFRELMQRRYDVHARAVLQTLATNPGLRSATAGTSSPSEDSDICDLAAVRAFVSDDLPAQAHGAQSEAWNACVVSGLRMLPTFRGVTYTWYTQDEAELSLLSAGQLFTPDHILRTQVRSETPAGSALEVVIWSESGRRTGVLLTEDTREAILFPAWTSFRVLVCKAGRNGAPTRLLLRQLTTTEAKGLSGTPGDTQAEVQRDTKARSGLLAAIGEPAAEIPAGVAGAVR